MKSQWPNLALDTLEDEVWGTPDFGSHLVTRTHELRTVPLKDFSIEDLRIMLGQNIGTRHLLPLAVEVLEEDVLAEGDFYPGDLLSAVLRLPTPTWHQFPKTLRRLRAAVGGARSRIEAEDALDVLALATEKGFL